MYDDWHLEPLASSSSSSINNRFIDARIHIAKLIRHSPTIRTAVSLSARTVRVHQILIRLCVAVAVATRLRMLANAAQI